MGCMVQYEWMDVLDAHSRVAIPGGLLRGTSCKWVELQERTPCACVSEQMQRGFWGCSLKHTMMWKKKITCCSCCCRHLLKACADGADFPLRYCVSTLETRKTGKERSKDNALSWSFYRMFVCRCKWWAVSGLLAKTLLSLLALYDTCFQTLPQVLKDYPISNGMPNYCSYHQWWHKILKKLLNML